MWTDVLKKLPKENLVTSVFSSPQRSYEYTRYGDKKLLFVKDGKLVNVRQWIKQLKATVTATYDAIIDNAQKPGMEDVVPLSSLTPVIAPFRNNALSTIKSLESKIKTIERGKGTLEEISHNDIANELGDIHLAIRGEFEAMFDSIKTDIDRQYAESLFGGLDEERVAESINPKMKTSVSPKQKDKLRFRTDTRTKVDYQIILDVDNINPQTNTRVFPKKSAKINFNYQHLPITLPPALYDDISMGEEGQDYVQQKIINVLEGSVPLYVKRMLTRKLNEALDETNLVVADSTDNMAVIKLNTSLADRQIVPYMLEIRDFIEKYDFLENDMLVQFEFSPDGNAPLNIIKMAVKDFYGMRTKSVQVNDSGDIASLEDITALEPERQRLSEEEQEQTGGGYYPALESYLDRTSDEERSRLEQYKYTIDTNMEGGKHITTILLNNKRIFRFGYQMLLLDDLHDLVNELIRKELEAVKI
tara:strand:+ start:4231 stop:5652 length:1422 start_codon:yes stop_codon:yes gene_type:complete